MLFNAYKTPTIRDMEYVWSNTIAPKFAELGFVFEKSWLAVRLAHTEISPLTISLTKRVRYSKALMKELITMEARAVKYIEDEYDYIISNSSKVTIWTISHFINKLAYLYTVTTTKDSLEIKRLCSQTDKLLKSSKVVEKDSSKEDDEEF